MTEKSYGYRGESSKKINNLIAERIDLSHSEISRQLIKLGYKISKSAVTRRIKIYNLYSHLDSLKEDITKDVESQDYKRTERRAEKKYNKLIEEFNILKSERDAFCSVPPINTHHIKSTTKLESEATAVTLASDWHIEERVSLDETNNLNEYNLDISKERSHKFFQRGLLLVDMLSKDVSIKRVILGLLGDFISNSIHEELMESNYLSPVHAIIRAQNYIASGIEFFLKNSSYEFTAVCHSGNHGRTTKGIRHGTEQGNSLEYFMYHQLANHFRNEKRINFIIPDAYHSYIKVYDYTLRFHHGHYIRYGGGIGGITIPVNKAIAQWNKSKPADIDCFGHFHQALDLGNFVGNGSMIGYNSFAISIKASFEPPRQTLFLIDKRFGKTGVFPILFN